MGIFILQAPTPASSALRAYEPMLYKLNIITAGTAPPAMLAALFINGQPFGQPAVFSHQEFDLLLEYIFYYDPKEAIKLYFQNEQSWGAINAQTSTTLPVADAANTGFYKKCFFEVQFFAYEQIPPSNSLEITDDVTSPELVAFNASALSSSKQDLTPFLQYPAEWFHNYTRVSNIQRAAAYTRDGGNNFFLTYYCAGNKDESLEIKLYDFSGALISTHFLNLNQSNGSVQRLRRLGVGVANINNALSGAWRGTPPTQPLLTSSCFYYQVRVVETDALLNVVNPYTKFFRFYISDRCEQIQVFYCNEFGADEVILFDYKDCEISYSNENTTYNNPILAFPTPALRGATTATASGTTLYRLSGIFAPNRAEQLKQLWISPNIALLLPNETQYRKVVKADNNEMITKRINDGRIEFEINLIASVIDNSQRG
jgi:hypothetical protein